MKRTFRLATAVNVALGSAMLIAASGAVAQNATRGKQLYENTNNAPLSCSAPGVCHGPDPNTNLNKVKNGTTGATIQTAVTNVALMNFLSAYLSNATDRADIAAYIVNPAAAGSGGGGGGGGSLAASATSMLFGATQIATSSSTPSPASITVTNGGTASITITAVNKSGTNANEFTPTGSCVAAAGPVVIAPGANCTLGATFMPSGLGTRTATLTIASNSPTNPAISLSGLGSATPVASVALNRTAVAFRTQTVATTSAAQDVTVTNAGQAPLMINNVATSPMPEFVSTTNCLTTLQTGASCTVTVVFTPAGAGNRTGNIAVTSNVGTTNIPMAGFSVLTPTAIATPDKTTMAFAATPVGAKSAVSSFTLNNTGNAPLEVSAVTLGGTDASQFKMVTGSTCRAGTMAAFASCRVDLTFEPESAGSKTATVTVAHNASGGNVTMTATGSGALATASSSAVAPSNIGGVGAASPVVLAVLALTLLLVPVVRRRMARR